jgi:hypothetical protein
VSFNKKHNDVLTKALEAEARREQAQYFTGEAASFSPEFEQRMERLAVQTRRRAAWRRKPGELLRQARDWVVELFTGEYSRAGYYSRQRTKRDAACIMMIGLLVFATSMTRAPASYGRTELTFHEYRDGLYSVLIEPQRGYVYPEELETVFTLSNLPDGYMFKYQWAGMGSREVHTVWMNEQDGKVELQQNMLNVHLELNVDHVPGEEVRVGRQRGQLFICQNHILLLWTTDYAFTLEVHDPSITPEQVVKIAEGLAEDENFAGDR